MSGRSSLTARRDEPILAAILEFQSPSAAVTGALVPRAARGTIRVISSLFAACLAAMGLIPIDRVVSVQGKVVSKVPTLLVQPLETSIVRSIDVAEGQTVRAGDVLARLDPTFAEADAGALASQVSALQAEVARLEAEANGRPFSYTGDDPNMSLQSTIFGQREAERYLRQDVYRQRIAALQASVERSAADAQAFQGRKAVAERLLAMRKELERRQAGTLLNSLAATDNLLEVSRGLTTALQNAESARRDLEALKAERDAFEENWRADVTQKLSAEMQKLADAREQLSKAKRRRQLVELRASQDATVLALAKVSVGSVLQSGSQLMTLVPAGASLEVEASISGHDEGFVKVGAPVAIKFDAFPFAQYGLAHGGVRTVSADSFTPQDEVKARIGPAGAEPFYRCRITIDDVRLHDLPDGFHVAPGMPVTADIRIGKRTVLAYLLGRILPVASQAMREP